MEVLITSKQQNFIQKQIQNGKCSFVYYVIRADLLLLDDKDCKLDSETEKRDTQ